MSRFFSFFDRSTDVKELEKTDIEKWITYLCNDYTDPRSRQRISEATVKGTVIKVKAVFEWAKKENRILENPFNGIEYHASFINPANEWIITMPEYERLLNVCLCQQWRAIWALLRIGGLRPGEVKEPAWIGHSRKVAQDHYYRISENGFLDALQPSTMSINFPC